MGTDEPVLLLGTDRYVLRACERIGVKAVVIYDAAARDNAYTVLPECATGLFVEDVHNPSDILAALERAELSDAQFQGIQTTDEHAVTLAAMLGLALNCRSYSPATAVHFRDKFLQKALVRRSGVRTAQSHFIEDICHLPSEFSFGFERAVLKPVAGVAASSTYVVSGAADVAAVSARCRDRKGAPRSFVLEEFISGDEWYADGIVFDGKVIFSSIGRYSFPALQMVGGQRSQLMRRFNPGEEEWAFEKAEPVVKASLAALGLTDGVFHMELFHDPDSDQIIFSECAARRGGGGIQEEVSCKFNVDLAEAALSCAIGRRPQLNVKVHPDWVATLFLPSRPGILMSHPSAAEMRELPGVEYVRFDFPFGYQMPDAASSTSVKIGIVVFRSDGAEDLSDRHAKIERWFEDRLRVAPAGVTRNDLRAWQRAHWPEQGAADDCYTPAW